MINKTGVKNCFHVYHFCNTTFPFLRSRLFYHPDVYGVLVFYLSGKRPAASA